VKKPQTSSSPPINIGPKATSMSIINEKNQITSVNCNQEAKEFDLAISIKTKNATKNDNESIAC